MDIDTTIPWIPFHNEIFEKIGPLLQEQGFKLLDRTTSRPEYLMYQREAPSYQNFARIIIHGGRYFPANRINIQVSSRNIHLMDATKLIEGFKSDSIFGGWGYTTKVDLATLVDGLVVFMREKLLKWIENPFPEPPINLADLLPQLDAIKKSLPIAQELIERFRKEGNIQETEKWEKVAQHTQELIAKLEAIRGVADDSLTDAP